MTGQGSLPDRSRYQQGVIRRAYEHKDTIALRRLSEVVSDLYLSEGAQKRKLWDSAKLALAKLAPNDPEAEKVVARKDVEGLARLVTKLGAAVRAEPMTRRDDAAKTSPPPAAPLESPIQDSTPPSVAPPTADEPPTPEMLKRAMKAFRKRLKLKKLDDESRLGRSPMTGGKQSAVVAIMAPREFSPAVWQELVRQGKLRHAGGSFYELAE